MNALQLSQEYFDNVAKPLLKRDFPELYPRLAAGLAGNGSECYGYDDEISRDHDWGVDFFIWALEEDRDMIPTLAAWKEELFEKTPPAQARSRSQYGAPVDVMTCADFFSSMIGTPGRPKTLGQWLSPPEENFAMAVNGGVFFDGPGEFTAARLELLDHYPQDIRLKKIAAKCMALAQTGQYNHGRTALRGDTVTLRSVLARFTDAAIAMAFLLSKVYMPYYKWAFKAMRELPRPAGEVADLLAEIAGAAGFDDESQARRQDAIEKVCAIYADELRTQGLSDSGDSFMVAHGESVMRGIATEALRNLPAQYEV
ncbi:MAG: DUF4037 domain-containing protein [Oscillospiraceae bacterium]|nr:DUF4037 domain-containing protein [Oscillospiraceae bacterium]